MPGWDRIVVGAGSAGAIIAARLAERGQRVLLLEAGPDFPDVVPELLTTDLRVPVLEHDWGFRSEGDREIDLPRGKVVGGSSATNAVAAVRPQPADLDGFGIPEWSWEACLSALCRFESDQEFGHESYHGTDGPIHIERPDIECGAPVTRAAFEAVLAAGYADCPDQNAPGATGAGPQAVNARDGVRQSTLVTYVRAARALSSFELRADALVERVVVRGSRVVGVCLDDGEVLLADEVILSAGAFCSPAILMRSGIGPADHLSDVGIPAVADLPVGEGLQDHPALGLLALANDASMLDRSLLQRFMLRTSFDGRTGEEDVHIFGPFTAEAVRAPMTPEGFVLAGMVVKPRSRGHVRLRSSESSAPPRITLNYFAEPADLDAMVACLLAIEELFDQPALQKVIGKLLWRPSEMDRDELRAAVRAGALTDHHPTGTCAIGPVLDPHLRVKGIDGLRVCDASIFPDTPRANTNLPTMMAAERLVELLDAEG